MNTNSTVARIVGPLIGLLLGLAVSGLSVVVLRAPRGQAIAVLPAPTQEPTATAAPLRIYMSGAVGAPGVYALAPGSLVQDALAMAGGALAGADLAHLDLARAVRDGETLYVPRVGEVPPGGAKTPRPTPISLSPGDKIDINTATAAQFDALPKIGPATAQAIVQYRQEHGGFKTIEELNEVSGIGDATFAALKEYVCVCTP